MEIEICCGSIQSAANAKAGGAVRVELCQGLIEGGTTPSPATIEFAVKELGLQVFVLVRPRGGDFCYNELEIKTMEEDVEFCKKAGVAGIVVGALLIKTAVDLLRGSMSELTECSLPEETEQEILDVIRATPDVFDPHNLRTRRIGSHIAIEVHVRMSGDTPLQEAHEKASLIERKLRERFGSHTHVNIHMEPVK